MTKIEKTWSVYLYFSDGKEYSVPEVFETQEEALAKVPKLLTLNELRELDGKTLTGWMMSQLVRWVVRPTPATRLVTIEIVHAAKGSKPPEDAV